MTVRELINRLREYPADSEVMAEPHREDFSPDKYAIGGVVSYYAAELVVIRFFEDFDLFEDED